MHGHLLPAAVGMFGGVFTHPVARWLGQHTRRRWLAKLGSCIGLLCIFKIIIRWEFSVCVSRGVRWAQRPLPIPVLTFDVPAPLSACVQVRSAWLVFVCAVWRRPARLISPFSPSRFWFQQLRTHTKKIIIRLSNSKVWGNEWHLALQSWPTFQTARRPFMPLPLARPSFIALVRSLNTQTDKHFDTKQIQCDLIRTLDQILIHHCWF